MVKKKEMRKKKKKTLMLLGVELSLSSPEPATSLTIPL